MVEFMLPRMIGRRGDADRLVASVGGVAGAVVVVNCRELVSASSHFGGDLVRSVLVEGGARRLVLAYTYEEIARGVAEAAERYHVADRVEIGAILSA